MNNGSSYELEFAPHLLSYEDEVRNSKLFQAWVRRINSAGKFPAIHVNGVEEWEGNISSLQVMVRLKIDDNTETPTEYITIRTPTVDVLTVLIARDTGKAFLGLVRQWRSSMGDYILSNPAGGIDLYIDESPDEAAAREVTEELGLDPTHQPVVRPSKGHPLPPSPGTSNEQVYFRRALVSTMTEKEILALDGRRGGVADEGEETTVVIAAEEGLFNLVSRERHPDGKMHQSFKIYSVMTVPLSEIV